MAVLQIIEGVGILEAASFGDLLEVEAGSAECGEKRGFKALRLRGIVERALFAGASGGGGRNLMVRPRLGVFSHEIILGKG